MKLSREEEAFLRHWIYDEAHYQQGQGPAKRSQIDHKVRPADLAVLIAAGLPDLNDQQAAATTPPDEPPRWPWSSDSFSSRLEQARRHLGLPA